MRPLILLLLACAATASATPIYQLRFTGTVATGSVDSLANGPFESYSVAGARFVMTVDIDFDQRPAPVIQPSGFFTELLYSTNTLAPEWITGVTVTFLDFPAFTANALPVSTVRQTGRLARPPSTTDVTPPSYEAELRQVAALNFTRIVLDTFDNISTPGAGTRQRDSRITISLTTPSFFDVNSITPFPLTALAPGPDNSAQMLSFESFDTGDLNQGVFGYLAFGNLGGQLSLETAEGAFLTPEPGTWALMLVGAIGAWARRLRLRQNP